MVLDLSDIRLWNKRYLPAISEPKYYNLLYGGAGSGKSQTMIQLFLMELLNTAENQHCTFFVIRKVKSSLRNSVFQSFIDKITAWDLHKFCRVKSSLFEITHGTNRIVFMGCDDPEKLKSLSEGKAIWIEEATELSKADFTQITLRLRGISTIEKKIYLTFNPVSDSHWIKKRFFDEVPQREKDMILSIRSNYLDNLDKLNDEYVDTLEALEENDETYYQIYALGEWGVWERDKLFCLHFNEKQHVMELPIPAFQNHPLHLSFDFNSAVANSCVVAQIERKPENQSYWANINIIRTYRIRDLEQLCQTIKREFPGMLYIIHGDATGDARSAVTGDNVSAYHLICTYLNVDPEHQLKIFSRNMSHASSRLHMNLAFKKCNIRIARYCMDGSKANEDLIADCKSAKVDEKQSLEDWKKKNPEMGHVFDCFRYLIDSNCYELVAESNLVQFNQKLMASEQE